MQEEIHNEPKEVAHPTFMVDKAILQVVHLVHSDVAIMPSFQKRILGMLSLPKNDGKIKEKRNQKNNTTSVNDGEMELIIWYSKNTQFFF